MATTTPNFGWSVPTSTDLVKDGATAIETLGDAIDASLVDLKGGTTGQILSKNSGTDMDFTWVTSAGDIEGVTAGVGITGGGTSGTVTITNDMATTITAAGDIVVGTGSGTYDNLPIGTTGQILTADTTVSPYKVKWATPAAAAKSYALINTGGTALTGASTITVSGISGKSDLFIVVVGMSSVNGSSTLNVQINSDTASNYQYAGPQIIGGSGYDSNNFLSDSGNFTSIIRLGRTGSVQGIKVNAWLSISGANSSGVKPFSSAGGGDNNGGNSSYSYWLGGIWNNTATISSIDFLSGNGNFDAGTVYIYGAA